MTSFGDVIKQRIIQEGKSSSLWLSIHKKTGGVFYRGVNKSGKGLGLGALGNGVYLTWEEGMANAFASVNKSGKVMPKSKGTVTAYKVSKNLKILDKDDKLLIEIKKDMGFSPWQWSDDPMFAKIITNDVKEAGYDGIISHNPAEGLCVFDDKNVKKL